MQEKRGYSLVMDFFVHRKKERIEKEKMQPNVKQIDKEFWGSEDFTGGQYNNGKYLYITHHPPTP